MSTRKVLIVLSCAAALVIAWQILASQDSLQPVDQPLAIAARETAATLKVPQPSVREPVIAIVSPAEPAALPEVPDVERPVMTDIEAANALYGEKYRGAKMADLVVARYDLELRRDTERDRIFKELLDRDELEVVKPGETVGTRPGGSPVVSATFKQERLADRTTIWKQKVIEPEKYPEFHALEMETWWVECEVHHREILAREGK